MLILAIDTCGPTGSVALARLTGEQFEVLAQSHLAGKTYSAQLVPAIAALLGARNAAGLGAIVVTSGPGSFTGIRIGLSTAKGLAEVHAVPIVAVSRLAVLAHKAQTPAAALDAARHEFYLRDGSAEPAEQLVDRATFIARAGVLGPSMAVCEPVVHRNTPAAPLVEPPTAADAIACALARLRVQDFDNPAMLDGNYLRRSDAEIFAGPGAGVCRPTRPGARP
jgi:tRNA threonylcarbamoyladenosine biosynthesis protein TsaB